MNKYNMKAIVLFGLLFFAISTAYAKKPIKVHIPKNGCRFNYTDLPGNVTVELEEPSSDIQKIWDDLLESAGVTGINAQLKSCKTREFESFVDNGTAWIVYNPELFD